MNTTNPDDESEQDTDISELVSGYDFQASDPLYHAIFRPEPTHPDYKSWVHVRVHSLFLQYADQFPEVRERVLIHHYTDHMLLEDSDWECQPISIPFNMALDTGHIKGWLYRVGTNGK